MPKIPSKLQKQVAKSEAFSSGPLILPAGEYAARLAKVEQRESKSSDHDYLSWEFRHLHNTEGKPMGRGRQWLTTSFSPKALGGVKAAFEAFGYTLDSDTDEMVGEWAVLSLSVGNIETGARAGEKTNRVRGISSFDSDEWDFDPEAVPEDIEDPEETAPGGDNTF